MQLNPEDEDDEGGRGGCTSSICGRWANPTASALWVHLTNTEASCKGMHLTSFSMAEELGETSRVGSSSMGGGGGGKILEGNKEGDIGFDAAEPSIVQ